MKGTSPVFRRKIYGQMLEWKKDWSGRYALLIEGARRVGKTTVVREFAAKEYENFLYIDFSKPLDGTLLIFEKSSGNLDRLLSNLGALYNVEMAERRTLIIFDEVQNYPKARGLIKYLVEDGRFDYIETGSLISMRKNVENITIPSEEMRIEMHPMDFEEFCWAGGDELTVPFIRQHFADMQPLGDALHCEMMERYRAYMLVGGMPQAVDEYWRSKDFIKTEKVKRQILALYRDDMGKIPAGYGTKARTVFDRIPSMLSFRRKVFRPSHLKKGSRKDTYADSVSWLEEAEICNTCYICSVLGKMLNLIRGDDFKCYLLDTGLLISMALEGSPDSGIYASFIKGDLSINNGMFFENMVAQELKCAGHKLFYYEFYSPPGDRNLKGIDFVLPAAEGITPVEVKSGKISSRHASLDAFASKCRGKVQRSYVVHSRDLRTDGDTVYIPIYMAMFL